MEQRTPEDTCQGNGTVRVAMGAPLLPENYRKWMGTIKGRSRRTGEKATAGKKLPDLWEGNQRNRW